MLLAAGVLARQPARADMFRVAANMNETYYGEDVQQRKSNLVSGFFFDKEVKATLSVVAAPSSPPTKDQKEGEGEKKEPVAAAHQQPCPMVP